MLLFHICCCLVYLVKPFVLKFPHFMLFVYANNIFSFIDLVISSDNAASVGGMIREIKCEQSWPALRFCSFVLFEGGRKTICRITCPRAEIRTSNTPNTKAEMLCIDRAVRSVGRFPHHILII